MSDVNNPGPRGANSTIISGTQSRFLTIPPRIEIRIQDDRTGSYPVIRRTGDHDRMGFMSSTFNDSNTPIFGASYQPTGTTTELTGNILYPNMLPVGSQLIQGLTGTIVAFGSSSAHNAFIPNLISQSIMPGGAAPETLTPFDESRIYLDRSPFYLTGTSQDQMLGFSSPLKDKTQIRFDITHDAPAAHYATRISKHSKTGGTVTAAGDLFLTSSSEFYNRDMTGFAYYNWAKKRWEDTGNIDPAMGSNIPYDWAWHAQGNTGESNNKMVSGATHFPFQFTPCQATQGQGSEDPLRLDIPSQNFRRAGYPTVTGMAPFDTRYHGTSSHCLKLSDYISSPFLLEKIVVELPVFAQRQVAGTGSQQPSHAVGSDGIPDGAAQDNSVPVYQRGLCPENMVQQQDYVFFIYRQQRQPVAGGKYSGNNSDDIIHRNSGRDSALEISGSQRFLICSGVMTFYNTGVLNAKPQFDEAQSSDGVSPTPPQRFWGGEEDATVAPTFASASYQFEPQNGPAFKHKFIVDPLAGTGSTSLTPAHFMVSGTYTGSVRLEIQPAVVGASFHGHFYCPDSSAGYVMKGTADGNGTDSQVANGNAELYNYWPGGTACKPFRAQRLYESGSLVGGKDTVAVTQFGDHTYGFYPSDSEQADPQLPIQKMSGTSIQMADPRTSRPFGGPFKYNLHPNFQSSNSEIGFEDLATGTLQQKAPYLLLPTDELIFGLEAAIPLTYFQNFYTATGSRLAIATPQLHNNVAGLNGARSSVTFYGSLIREGKEYHETLNQNLTSPNIHEAIIGAPVVDQYDIGTREQMIGTYVDNYIVGDIFHTGTTSTQGGPVPSPAGQAIIRESTAFIRTVIGSFASGTATPRNNVGTKTYYGSGSIQRFVKASSRIERFYDTFLPDIYQYIIDYKGCGHFTIYPGRTLGGSVAFGNYLAVSGSVVNNLQGNRMKLPYDNEIKRVPDGWGPTWSAAEPTSTEPYSAIYYPARLVGMIVQQDIASPVTAWFASSPTVAIRKLFLSAESLPSDVGGSAASVENGGPGKHDQGISGSARGFPYGILDINPKYTSAVYRWNRYGQFRDMLEQRQDGKFFTTQLDSTQEDAAETTAGLKRAVVVAKFVKPSSTSSVDPGQTQCSNLSFECTSSVPYYDGLFRNRDIEIDKQEEFVALV